MQPNSNLISLAISEKDFAVVEGRSLLLLCQKDIAKEFGRKDKDEQRQTTNEKA